MAALLNVPAEDVAKHAGVSTPVPKADALAELSRRLERVERKLEELQSLLARRHE